MKKTIKENYVQINDLKMQYLESGNGYPLIFLHGGIVDAKFNWEKQIAFFSQKYRVIAPDSRGHGKTDNPSREFSYRKMADDVAALIDALELEKPFICGWSDGGQIALEVGIRHPNISKGLILGGVLIEITDYYVNGMKAWGINGPGDIDFKKLEETLPDFVKMLPEIHSTVYGKEYWKQLLINISKMWVNPDEFPKNKIEEISVPSLIIQGDRDVVIEIDEAIKMFRQIPQAELCILPNAGHDVYETDKDLFNSIVLEFLSRHNS